MMLAAMLLGVMTAVAGYRLSRSFRRRIRENHGYCAVCGYSVRQLPDQIERCPECGHDTATPIERSSIRRLLEDAAPLVTLAGVVLVLTTARGAWGDLVAIRRSFIPTSTLINDFTTATSQRDPAAVRADEELTRRWRAGSLGEPDGRALGAAVIQRLRASGLTVGSGSFVSLVLEGMRGDLADPASIGAREAAVADLAMPNRTQNRWVEELLAFAVQENNVSAAERRVILDAAITALMAGRPIAYYLADTLNTEIVSGRLPIDRVLRPLADAIEPTLTLPDDGVVRPESVVPVGVDLGVRASWGGPPLTVSMELLGDDEAWTVVQPPPGPPAAMRQTTLGDWTSLRADGAPPIRALISAPSAPGEYEIAARVTIWCMRREEADGQEFTVLDEDARPLGAFSFVVTGVLRVEGERDPPPVLVETPFERDDFGECDACGNFAWRSARTDAVGVKLLLDSAPVDVSALVLLEQEGVEHKVGWTLLPAGRSSAVVSGMAPGVVPGPVRIILRPDLRPLTAYPPERLIYERDLVIRSKVWGPEQDAAHDHDG